MSVQISFQSTDTIAVTVSIASFVLRNRRFNINDRLKDRVFGRIQFTRDDERFTAISCTFSRIFDKHVRRHLMVRVKREFDNNESFYLTICRSDISRKTINRRNVN